MQLRSRLYLAFIIILSSIQFCFGQTYLGNYSSYSVHGKSIRVFAGSSSVSFIFYQPDILRVDFLPALSTVPDSSFTVIQDTLNAAPFTLSENDSSLIISSSSISIICKKIPLRFSFFTSDGKQLLSEPISGGIEFNQQQRAANFVLNTDEHFYGTGERGTSLDKRDLAFDSYNVQIGEYTYPLATMNTNIPFLATNNRFGIFFDNTYHGRFDLGSTDPSKFSYTAYGGELTYYLIVSPEIPGQLEEYTWLTGRQPLPPRWAFGFIQSKYGYRNESSAEAMIQTMRSDKIPCDAIILDLYWFKNMGDASWDLSNWQNPNQMMKNFLSEGIKTIAITEPYITSGSINYSYAISNGYFAKNQTGGTYILNNWWSCGCNAALIDMTNPSAQSWWWSKYPLFMDTLMAGLWTDLGEPERDDTSMQFYSGSDAKVHNIYNLLWAKTIFNGFENFRSGKRIFNLTRSGFAGIQRYGVIPWSGDVGKDFRGLAVQLPMLLNMGMSGMAYHNSDIGGFSGGFTTPELYTRWMEYGTFCPITRAHGYDGIQNTEPWTFNDTTLSICRKYIQLRYKLLPYIYTMAYEDYKTGLPLARPLFFDHPNDNNLTNESSSYMWGDNFLVSPVVQSGQSSKSIYLPNGNWVDYWSDKIFQGGQSYTISTPIDKLPLFVKEGSIIPMQPLMDYSDEYPLDTLYLEVYPSTQTRAIFNLYEDDGKTLAYQSGSFSQTEFSASVSTSDSNYNLNFSISPSIGNYDGKPQHRIYLVDLHLISNLPSSVELNGNEMNYFPSYKDLRSSYNGFYYDSLGHELIMKLNTVPDSNYSFTVRNILLGIKDRSNQIPSKFALLPNYPNPFNPTTNIDYQLSVSGKVVLKIFDVLGREIETLVNADQQAGNHSVVFNGSRISSGIYFYKIEIQYSTAGIVRKFTDTKKLVLIK